MDLDITTVALLDEAGNWLNSLHAAIEGASLDHVDSRAESGKTRLNAAVESSNHDEPTNRL